MTSKFLITGGEGFIGSSLRDLITKSGDEARTLDIAGNPDYRISVTDFGKMMDIRERFDGIFHLAATTSPPQFEDNPIEGFSVNVNGTLNVLEFAKRNGVPRVVLASSSAIYGDSMTVSVEDKLPGNYSNLYPITKITDEHLARYYSIRNEVECISLRYFNTFGPGENSKGMYSSPIWKFIQFAQSGDPIIIYGDGKQSRDFIYIKDNVRATWLAFQNGIPGESYNIGTGISTDFNTIAKIVREITVSDSEIRHVPNPLRTYQMFTQADMTKTKRDLKFSPEYDLARSIREMANINRAGTRST
jgi:UDP-glucose 4-epimerase